MKQKFPSQQATLAETGRAQRQDPERAGGSRRRGFRRHHYAAEAVHRSRPVAWRCDFLSEMDMNKAKLHQHSKTLMGLGLNSFSDWARNSFFSGAKSKQEIWRYSFSLIGIGTPIYVPKAQEELQYLVFRVNVIQV